MRGVHDEGGGRRGRGGRRRVARAATRIGQCVGSRIIPIVAMEMNSEKIISWPPENDFPTQNERSANENNSFRNENELSPAGRGHQNENQRMKMDSLRQ